MSFSNISNLKVAPVQSALYFIDANAWIYSMQNFDNLDWWAKYYYDFFYEIIESKLSPKPQIILPSLLISEIINTYLRQIAIPDYRLINNIPAAKEIKFKRDYRPTDHYKKSFERLMDDIMSFKSSILFLDDSRIVNDATLLNKNTGIFDYNDYLYHCLCKELKKEHRVIIVTHDSDFQVNDIEIATMNKTLLSL